LVLSNRRRPNSETSGTFPDFTPSKLESQEPLIEVEAWGRFTAATNLEEKACERTETA
jgi:hypothetical protein